CVAPATRRPSRLARRRSWTRFGRCSQRVVNCCMSPARYFRRRTSKWCRLSSHEREARIPCRCPTAGTANGCRARGTPGSFTPCSKNKPDAVRRIAFLARFALLLASLAAGAARADDIEVRGVALRATEEGLMLDADFAFELTPRLAEVVANGVPLYFRVEFELIRRRWYWFDDTTAVRRLQVRLSYHALSRQYRLSTGLLQQNFSTLEEALNVLKRVRNWLVVERSVPLSGDYEAALRMRHDVSLLPKPFQLSALTARDLHLDSACYRFTVRALEQARAPVESRDLQGAPPR